VNAFFKFEIKYRPKLLKTAVQIVDPCLPLLWPGRRRSTAPAYEYNVYSVYRLLQPLKVHCVSKNWLTLLLSTLEFGIFRKHNFTR